VEARESQGVRCGRKPEVLLKWEPPRAGLFKVDVDASTRGDGKKGVGVVVVVRDSKEDVKVMACRSFKANWEVETVEAYAVLCGL